MSDQLRDLKQLLGLLKEEGVSEFKGFGFELKLDPHVSKVQMPLPKNLFEDDLDLTDAADGEKKEAFQRAQDEYKKNLMWSVG